MKHTEPYRVATMSYRQFGTLRHVKENRPSLDSLRGFHQITLWSLLHRGYVRNHGGTVELTEQGHLALSEYQNASYSARRVESDLTERVNRLLRAARARRAA